MRTAYHAPRRLEIERRAGGELVLTNPAAYATAHQTMTSPLELWAQAAPSRVWLAERSGEGWRSVAFGEARERIRALAAGLRDLGLTGARPLLILSANALDHALIAYAAMSQGVPIAPVSAQYGLRGANLARLTHACEVLNPAAVYVEDAALFADGLAVEALTRVPVIAGRNARPGDVPLDALYRAGEAAPVCRPEDHAKYLLTSGSTGLPRAVVCTHRTISLNSAQIDACFEDPDPPVMVNSAPWSHSLGANSVLHLSLHRGGSLYIDRGQPTAAKFGETLRNLKEVSPTYQNMIPATWIMLAEALDEDEQLARTFFAKLRVMQYGGAPLSPTVGVRIQACAVRTVGERITFAGAYGSTEVGPTACTVHWPNERMGLIGLPIPGTSVKLVPEAGKLAIRVKGPQLSPGYLGRPELSATMFDEEGFYISGDAVRLIDPEEPRGGLVFDGRLSENFKLANGSFVNCGELRVGAVNAVGPAVTDAVVCGEGEAGVGLLFFPCPSVAREEVEAAVGRGLAAFNARARSVTARVARALVLPDAPDHGAGEITDKGYISQATARTRRAHFVQRLFAEPTAEGVMVFD